MNIRTHATTISPGGLRRALLPHDWEPGTPVLVVAGLPEGADLRRLCDVPEGWEWLTVMGGWSTHGVGHYSTTTCTGLVVCRPKPVPAPPATAREIAADELRVAEQHGCGFTDIGPTAVADRIIDRLSVAGLLAGPAPTEDDEPRIVNPRVHTEVLADTPAPQGRWIVDEGQIVFDDRDERRSVIHVLADDDVWTDHGEALLALVRRDGTTPTPEAVAEWLSTNNGWTEADAQYVPIVMDAVRALRDGGER